VGGRSIPIPSPIIETGVKTSRRAPTTPPMTKAAGKMPLVELTKSPVAIIVR